MTSRFFLGLLFLIGLTLTPVSDAAGFQGSAANEEPSTLKLKGQVLEFRLLTEDQNQIRFHVKLRLTFANEANEPVILLKQKFEVGTELLARSNEDAKLGKYLYLSSHWPSVSTAPEWASWQRKLDTENPSADLLFVIPPGNSISEDVETAINIRKAGSFDRTSKTWAEISRTATIYLQVVVQTWPTNLEPKRNPENPDFGQNLRKRWSTHGRLQLDRLTSEPIELNLSSVK